MESIINTLVSDFENGRLSRRQLIQALTMIALGAPAGRTLAKEVPPTLPPAPWKTVFLDHISYQVSDYKRSVDFYTNLLGWRVKEDRGTEATLDINGIGNIIIRNRPNAAASQPSSSGQAAPALGVVDHISWGIDPWDTEVVKSELEKRQLKPSPDMADDGGFKSFHVKDPDGVDLQISNETGRKQ
jgi:catechol 2,3-dioxygenase-like lactoylglutathione lyase family enzyme